MLCEGPTDTYESEDDRATRIVWEHIKRAHVQTRGVAETSFEQLSRCTGTPGVSVRSLSNGGDALIVIYEEEVLRGDAGQAA